MSRPHATPCGTAAAAILILAGAFSMASAPPAPSTAESDGLIYLPLEEESANILSSRDDDDSRDRGVKRPPTGGEVTIAPYGARDALVACSHGLLAVRFDPPFNAPYTITAISFPTRTQFQLPTSPGRFISVRILGMDPLTGLPDKPATVPCVAVGPTALTRTSGSFVDDGVRVGDRVTGAAGVPAGAVVKRVTATSLILNRTVTLDTQPQALEFVPPINHELRRVAVSSNGGMNTIPLEMAGVPGQTYFVVFQFPRPPASADTFPFLYTDRVFMEQGLFGNSFVTDTTGAQKRPLVIGTRGRTIDCWVDSSDIVVRTSGSFLEEGVKAGDRVSGSVPEGTVVIGVDHLRLRVNRAVPQPRTTGPPKLLPSTLAFSPRTPLGMLLDQNLVCAMTFRLTGRTPLASPEGLGLERREERVRWHFRNRGDLLADGTTAPRRYLVGTELLRRENHVWKVVDYAEGETERINRQGPGDEFQIWGVRAVDRNGGRSEVSSVTFTGTTNVQGVGLILGEDAQEPHHTRDGRPASLSALELTNTIWPAGDTDQFTVHALPGQQISVRARIPIGGYDFANDLVPRIRLLSRPGRVVAEAVGNGDPTAPVTLTYTTPEREERDDPRRYIVQVDDAPPGLPAGHVCRVLVPGRYLLSADIQDTGPSRRGIPAPAGRVEPEPFSFARLGANPARGSVAFRYVIPRDDGGETPVRLRIHDLQGRVVHTLVRAVQGPGVYSVVWPACDQHGRRVGTGRYFARLEAGRHGRTVEVDMIH